MRNGRKGVCAVISFIQTMEIGPARLDPRGFLRVGIAARKVFDP